MEGWINNFVAAEPPGRVRQRKMTNFPTPAFDECHGQRVGSSGPKLTAQLALRRAGELFPEIFTGALDFQGPDAGAGKDIAAGPDCYWRLGEPMPARGMIVAHVTD